MVQLSHLYMTTGKTIALTRQTFVGKVMSLLFKMLSRLVITFLPRSRWLLISWLQSQSAVILEPPKIVSHCFHSPSICHEVMGPDAMILVFWVLSFKPIFSLSCFSVIKRLFSRVHYVLCAEYIMWNAGLDESQAGIKIARRNINNLRSADDTYPYGRKQRRTKEPLDESERGEWKSWLKTQHSEN